MEDACTPIPHQVQAATIMEQTQRLGIPEPLLQTSREFLSIKHFVRMVTNGRWDTNSLFVRPLWERDSTSEENEAEQHIQDFQERFKEKEGSKSTRTISTRAWIKIKDDGRGEVNDMEGHVAAHLMKNGFDGVTEFFPIRETSEQVGTQLSLVKCCIGNLTTEPLKSQGSGDFKGRGGESEDGVIEGNKKCLANLYCFDCKLILSFTATKHRL